MNKQLKISFYIISAILILIGISISRESIQNPLPATSTVMGDLFVLLAFNLQLLIVGRAAHFEEHTTKRRLIKFGWVIFFLTMYIISASAIILNSSIELFIGSLDSPVFTVNILTASLIVFFGCFISVHLLNQLYRFILIRRKKSTKNILIALYINLHIYLILSSFSREDVLATGAQGADDFFQILAIISASLAIFFMVMSSYRNAWVNYLNKKQKVAVLFAGILAIAAIIISEQSMGNVLLAYMRSSSLVAAILFNLTRIYLLIYSTLAVLSLLLHLPTAGIFDKKVKQLTSLFKISNAIISVPNKVKLLEMATKQILEVCGADSSWIMLKESNDSKYALSASSNVHSDTLKMIRSEHFSKVTAKYTSRQKRYIYNSFSELPDELIVDRKNRLEGTLMGIPLISGGRGLLGIIFVFKSMDYAFDQEDAQLIEAFANQTAVAIDNVLLLEQSLEKERLQQQLEVARNIQLKLLPKDIPSIAENIEIEALSQPAHEVGGDYYDFIKLSDTIWGVYIADVSGKSVSAALYMAEIKGIIQALARQYTEPKKLIKKVNETLFTNIDRKSFVSMLAASVDIKKKKLFFTRAGHTPLIYFNPAEQEWSALQPCGLGLGLDKGGIFDKVIEQVEIELLPGTVFFMFTDGVTEVFDKDGEEFGQDRLIEELKNCQRNSESSYTKTVLRAVKSFSTSVQHDDITMIVIKVK